MGWSKVLLGVCHAGADSRPCASRRHGTPCCWVKFLPPTDHDVCVVGAGASGMFAAWKLQQKGLRVLVLEKAGYVGGHCNTFYGVPGFSGVPVEMGVQVYVNTPLVRSTLEELNIATGLQGFGAAAILLWSRDGTTVTPWVPNQNAVLGAALTWANLYATDFLAYMPSSAQVPNFTALPGEVRQRLLGSFGSYLDALLPTTKSALEPLLPVLAAFMNNGFSSYRDAPAYWTALSAPANAIIGLLAQRDDAVAIPAGCSTIYTAMAAALGPKRVLLEADFTVDRKANRVDIKFSGKEWSTQNTARGRVTCRRLLVSPVPSTAALSEFMKNNELSSQERAIFNQVTWTTYTASLVPASIPANAPVLQTHIVPEARYSDMPSTTGLFVLPFGVATAATNSLSPDWSLEQGLAQAYANATRWATNSGLFSVAVPRPSNWALTSVRHQYFPRFKGDPATWPALYEALFQLQVPGRPLRNTLYTGAMWSYGAQHTTWAYSKWLVDNADWTSCNGGGTQSTQSAALEEEEDP